MGQTNYAGFTTRDTLGADLTYPIQSTMSEMMGSNPTSNIQKVDKLFETQNSKLVTLENKLPIPTINATLDSTVAGTESFIATSSEITAYKDKMVILLSLSVANTMKATLNINTLGFANIVKYDATGALVDIVVGDLKKNNIYNCQMSVVGTTYKLIILGEDQNKKIADINATLSGITSGTTSVPKASAVPWSGVTDPPSTFPPAIHNHDNTYYTKTESDTQLSNKANIESGTWTPVITDINGRPATMSADTYGKWALTGNTMLVTATIKVTSKANMDNSGLIITGLPRQASPVYQGGVPGLCTEMTAQLQIVIETTSGGRINLYKQNSAGGVSRVLASDITDSFKMEGLSINYIV